MHKLLLGSFTAILMMAVPVQSKAQDDINVDSLSLEELDELLLSFDSTSFLDFLDSLLLFDSKITSQIGFRLGYTSGVLSAGRDLGFNQFGFSGGLSYYHKSGFYGDLTGFWNSDFTPQYNLTVITAGYISSIGKKWSYSGSYDRSFFNTSIEDSLDNPLTNSVSASIVYDLSFLNSGVDYSFLFGEETAHRIRWGLNGNFKIKNIWIFDKISFLPGFSLLLGNSNVVNLRFDRANIDFQNIDNDRLRRRIIRGLIFNPDETIDRILEFFTQESNEFGILNYGFNFPVEFAIGKFRTLVNYSYNIPNALPGEPEELLENSGFIGVTVSYTTAFGSNF